MLSAMTKSVQGMRVQGERINVIAQNIANASSLPASPEEDPYRRKVILFENEYNRDFGHEVVKVAGIETDDSDFGQKFDPSHPAANENGYVRTTNVQALIELQDMKEARRTYEANLGMISQMREMYTRTIDLLRT